MAQNVTQKPPATTTIQSGGGATTEAAGGDATTTAAAGDTTTASEGATTTVAAGETTTTAAGETTTTAAGQTTTTAAGTTTTTTTTTAAPTTTTAARRKREASEIIANRMEYIENLKHSHNRMKRAILQRCSDEITFGLRFTNISDPEGMLAEHCCCPADYDGELFTLRVTVDEPWNNALTVERGNHFKSW